MNIRHLKALFIKNCKDVLRNFQVLILFFVFPVIGYVMTGSVTGTEADFFLSIFATMHFVFSSIVITANLVAEEQEKNTLRMLRMSGVSTLTFFFSVVLFVLLLDLASSLLFLLMTEDTLQTGHFLAAGTAGSIISIVIGLCIGVYAKSSSAANGLAVPAGMVFSFLPMLAGFNENIHRISSCLYGQQVSNLLSGENWSAKNFLVILVNFLLVFALYCYLYRKTRAAR